MLCLSGFELYSRWVPLNIEVMRAHRTNVNQRATEANTSTVRPIHIYLLRFSDNDFGNEENIIMGGDFNCPLNVNLDKKGGIQVPRRHVVKCIEEIQDEFSLHDIWRIKKSKSKEFHLGSLFSFYIL